jgi:AraC-like DNA-binding protein
MIREGMSKTYDMKLPGSVESFCAKTKSCRIGPGSLFETRSSGIALSQKPWHIAIAGSYHFQLVLHLGGISEYRARKGRARPRVGDLFVIDTTRSSQSLFYVGIDGEDEHDILLAIPRSLLGPMLQDPDRADATTIRREAPIARVISEQLQPLIATREPVSDASAQANVRTLALLAARELKETAESVDSSRRATKRVLMDSIKSHIEDHLGDPDLSVEPLCRQFGLSRPTLFRVFAALGSPADYIWGQRLHRAVHLLCQCRKSPQRIIYVAMEIGFASNATFARAFRRRIGHTPIDARSLGVGGFSAKLARDSAPISNWTADLAEI